MKTDLRNVVLLGTAFLFFCATDQTLSNIQKTIDDSILNDDPTYISETYYSQAVGYFFNSVFNWLSPSVINAVGSKYSMVIGSLLYSVFILQYFSPKPWSLYFGSVCMGIGTAVIWTAQGTYITLNSTTDTVGRNSGIFCILSQFNMIIGNLFVMFAFKGKDEIDGYTRLVVVLTLAISMLAAIVMFYFLPKIVTPNNHDDKVELKGPVETFVGAIKLFFTTNMLLLSVSFLYTGLEIGFYSGVYSSCIGFTKSFENRKELVGVSGILMGVGHMFGGGMFTILGPKMVNWTKGIVVGTGCFVHILAFCLIFLNLPNNSPFDETDQAAIIKSNPYVAIFCSFLLGLGDSIYNNQFTALVGIRYSDNSAPVFAIILFFQSMGSALSTAFAQSLNLYYQLTIFLVMAAVSTVCFIKVEFLLCKEKCRTVSTDLKELHKNSLA